MTPRKYANAHERDAAARRRQQDRERREREGWSAKPKPVTNAPATSPAVERYRAEKLASELRNAEHVAVTKAAIARAVARADAVRAESQRGGRPKRLPAMDLRSDPANALVNAVSPWRGDTQ